jgi:hypothetical protein
MPTGPKAKRQRDEDVDGFRQPRGTVGRLANPIVFPLR